MKNKKVIEKIENELYGELSDERVLDAVKDELSKSKKHSLFNLQRLSMSMTVILVLFIVIAIITPLGKTFYSNNTGFLNRADITEQNISSIPSFITKCNLEIVSAKKYSTSSNDVYYEAVYKDVNLIKTVIICSTYKNTMIEGLNLTCDYNRCLFIDGIKVRYRYTKDTGDATIFFEYNDYSFYLHTKISERRQIKQIVKFYL